MRKQEIVDMITEMIKENEYSARVCYELEKLGFDVAMMNYHYCIKSGKAFGGMEIFHAVTGKLAYEIRQQAIEKATHDIIQTKHNIIKLLNLAGFDGIAYYNKQKSENS